MLDNDQKKAVDKAWDSIWSSGITNPIVVMDLFATILMTRWNDQSDWKELQKAVATQDVERLLTVIRSVRREHKLVAGSEIESDEFWTSTRPLEGAITIIEPVLISAGDIIGDIFEHILSKLSTAGTFGQFRTPGHIVKFLVDIVKPSNEELVMDPACGTGSFLIQAADYRRSQGLTGKFAGLEIDRTVARIAQANLTFHDIDNGEILVADGLTDDLELRPDVILANPPFAGTVSPEVKRAVGLETNKSELLFVRSIISRLTKGGRAGVIVPAGVLSTSLVAGTRIREQLVQDMTLEAVIELPTNAFSPYTTVKTAILLWRNEPPGPDHRILMTKINADGFSLDARRRPVEENDLPAVLEILNGNEEAIAFGKVSAEELADSNYNLTPTRYIAVTRDELESHQTPAEAFQEMEKAMDQVLQRIEKIKETMQ